MLTSLINRPCTILTEDDDDFDDFSEGRPSRSSHSTVCEIQQADAIEADNEGEVSRSDWVGYFLPADSEYLNTASAVVVPELGTFELVGAPWPARNPRTQAVSHVETKLRRTKGAKDT